MKFWLVVYSNYTKRRNVTNKVSFLDISSILNTNIIKAFWNSYVTLLLILLLNFFNTNIMFYEHFNFIWTMFMKNAIFMTIFASFVPQSTDTWPQIANNVNHFWLFMTIFAGYMNTKKNWFSSREHGSRDLSDPINL